MQGTISISRRALVWRRVIRDVIGRGTLPLRGQVFLEETHPRPLDSIKLIREGNQRDAKAVIGRVTRVDVDDASIKS